jgi:UPF0755 protein
MKKKILQTILLLLVASAGFFGWKLYGPALTTTNGEFFYVKTGSTLSDVKEKLIAEKYIQNDTWYNLVTKILRFKKAKPGRYKITNNMGLMELVRMFRSGNQSMVNFSITKFRTKEDFARKAGNMFEFDSLQMIGFLNNNDTLKKYGLDTNTVTAVMMPFTYSLNWNSTPEKVFQSQHTAFQKFWTAERKIKADSLHMTPIEVSTIASIVEEETNNKSDKLNIASTYLNRLRINMPLQADPTVKFGLKDFAIKRILLAHLKMPSPYNTYLNKGLPPGPICTPSVESIDAILNAPKTDYIYFVASSKFDGSSVFTSNYTDHLKYARLYQQELTKRMDSAKKANPVK